MCHAVAPPSPLKVVRSDPALPPPCSLCPSSCLLVRSQVTDLLEARPELTLGQMGNEVVADLLQAGTGVEVEESEVCVCPACRINLMRTYARSSWRLVVRVCVCFGSFE